MSLRRNAIANYVGQGWITLMGLAFIPLYIRYLGIETYGLIGVFALLQSWLFLLDLGMTPSISREMARFTAGEQPPRFVRDLLRTVEVSSLCVAAFVAIGIWLTSGWLAVHWLHAEHLPSSTVARAFSLMGFVAGTRFIENIYRSALVGLQRQVVLNVVLSAAATLRGAGAVLVLVWNPTVSAFFIWQGAVSVATLVALSAAVYRAVPASGHRARFSLAVIRDIWRFAAGTLAVTLLGFLLSQSDKLLLSTMLTLEQFAVYSLATTVASSVRILSQPIDQAVFPKFTELYHQQDEAALARVYHKAAQYNTVLMGSLGIFLAFFGEQVLQLWTKDPVLSHSTYAILWILVLGMVMNAIMNSPYYLQMAAGWTSLLIRVTGVMVIVFVPAIYLLTRSFGAQGAAAAWVLVNLVYLATVARRMHRRLLPLELRAWLTGDVLAPLAASVASASVVRALYPTDLPPLTAVLALALCFMCVLAAASFAAGFVRHELRTNLRLATARLR